MTIVRPSAEMLSRTEWFTKPSMWNCRMTSFRAALS
jgi:hypothetical protein